MTTYESNIETLNSSAMSAYELFSDLKNLEKFKDRLPTDKIKDIEFDTDSCRFSVDPIGKVGFVIVDKEEGKTIKFGAENSPVEANMWIQLKEVGENVTKMKLTIKAELPFLIKSMVDGKLKTFINQLSKALALAINSK
ncbi:MAG: SRPBCC family protein [Paludibacteraceae bacterium]|nr:SRPBCC family protein [Paludibacteraceae bacterium]